MRLAAATLLLAIALPGLGLLPATSPSRPSPEAVALAGKLRRLYATPGEPGERWRRRAPEVELEDGARVPRDAAYREEPGFVAAARELLQGGALDEALLGAWLLGTVPAARREDAARALVAALGHRDARVRFEAARTLGTLGSPQAASPLRELMARASPAEGAAARWALRRIAPRDEGVPRAGARLAPGFCRGVNWWHEETGNDAGAASFWKLAELGVDWVSIHTWDPLQRDVFSPAWSEPRRPFAIEHLEELVESAHAAGIKVISRTFASP